MSCVGCIYTIKNKVVKGKGGEMVEVGDVTCRQTYECAGADRVTEKIVEEARRESKKERSRKKLGE